MNVPPVKCRFVDLFTNYRPAVRTSHLARPSIMELKYHTAKRKERQFYQNYRSFLVEVRRDCLHFFSACGGRGKEIEEFTSVRAGSCTRTRRVR